MLKALLIALALFSTAIHSPATHAEPEAPPRARPFAAHPDAPSRSLHTVNIEGSLVTYLAEADIIELGTDPDTPTARLFTISYRQVTPRSPQALSQAINKLLTEEQRDELDRVIERDAIDRASSVGHRRVITHMLGAGVDPDELLTFPDPSTRPVTFSFNGGPGSSSVWLHLGTFGPRRVAYADDTGNPGPPPHRVVENNESLLDLSDFVFIDPVSTGYSRAVGDNSPKDFHGVESDIDSVAELIRRWTTTNKRWSSPKFVAGESYGTTRAAGLVRRLHDTHGMAVNGIVLVSSVLNFQTLRFDVGNDLPYILFLPTYTAAAHYHGALDGQLAEVPLAEAVERAERFAIGPYASALMQGDELPDNQRQFITRELARLTGLSESFIEQADLRISQPRFSKELLRTRSRTTGRLDARFTGIDRDDAGETYEFDPSYTAILANYTASMNAYLREDLGYESDLPYEILTSVWPWSYEPGGSNRYLNVAERMRRVLHQLPDTRVFIASGLLDLATPHFATEYTANHLALAPERRENIEIHDYPAGHMMYIHAPSRLKLRQDLAGFYKRTLED